MIEPNARNGTAFSGLTIGLLGGSFNPAHQGHRAMSLHAIKRLGLDQVWWLVSPQNPLKSAAGMEKIETRLACARRIAAHPQIAVTALEAALGTRYTVDTLHALQARFPRTRFVWLMGADNLRQITRWKDWEDIFRLVPVAVFRRPSYPAGRGIGRAAIRFGAGWIPPAHARKSVKNAHKPLPVWVILDNKGDPTSATALRKDKTPWPK